MLKKISIFMLVGFSVLPADNQVHDIDDIAEISYRKPTKPKLVTKEDMFVSAVWSFCQGAGQASGASLGGPVGSLVSTMVNPVVHPVRTFKNFKRNVFTMRHSNALTAEALVAFEHSISNAGNVLIIEPANASNKLLRKALVDQATGSDEQVDSEYAYATKTFAAHLTHFSNYLDESLKLYKSERTNSTGSKNLAFASTGAAVLAATGYVSERNLKDIRANLVLGAILGCAASLSSNSPYSKQELNQIIFSIEQIQSSLDFMITMVNGLNGLNQITDKKDAISMLLKNLLNEISGLIFVIDPSTAFDGKYQGLKIIYDDAKLNVDKGVKKA